MSFKEKWFDMVTRLNEASPRIKIVVGVVGLVGAGVAACIATTKVKEKTEEERKTFDDIHKVRQSQKNELPEEEKIPDDITACYSETDYAKDVLRTSGRMALKLGKVYGVPIAIAVVSICLIFNGTHVLNDRNLAMSAAYATLSTYFNEYRDKVKAKYGEEAEKELYYGVKYGDVTCQEKNEKGEFETKSVEHAAIAVPKDTWQSLYLIKFNRDCAEWCNDINYNETFLRGIQAMLNDKLKHKPFITFADLCEYIGYDLSNQSRTYQLMAMRCGWRHGDKIDLRIQKIYIPYPEEDKCCPLMVLDPNVRDIYAEIITENDYETGTV